VASLAVLSGACVLADVDVDASNLHLVLEPDVLQREEFFGGHRATIRPDACLACGQCAEACRFDAIVQNGRRHPNGLAAWHVDPIACEGCGVCTIVCPENAIDLEPTADGSLFVSETRCGPMVHAELGIAAANSGKLVTAVRQRARQVANQRGIDILIADGPPGTGCPVIAAMTGASLVLAVTEPTLSGEHDLDRVLRLASHFGIPAVVTVNKWDLNPELTDRIERRARANNAQVAARVRYDPDATAAQIDNQTIVDRDSAVGHDIRSLWADLRRIGDRRGIPL